jgi:hypothetical protein
VTELDRLLQRLSDAKIEFVIVDGFAAMLHSCNYQRPIGQMLVRNSAIPTTRLPERFTRFVAVIYPMTCLCARRISAVRISTS